MSNVQRLLNWLLYSAALLAILPVFPFVAFWVQLFLLAGLIGGLLRARLAWQRTSSQLAVLVTVIGVVVSAMELSMAEVAVPLVQILCVLLAARLVGEKSPRNMLQTFVLALALLAASSLLTLDMIYLVYLFFMILILSTSLVLLSFVHVDPDLQLSVPALKGLRIFLLAIPVTTMVLMVALFFILPRTPTPLWNIVGQEGTAAAGMSDQVRPGSFSELTATGEVAFRAEMPELPLHQLYWRGIVLDQLDGQVWRRSNRRLRERFNAGVGTGQEVVIYAEAKADLYLVALDRSERLQGVPHRSEPDGVFMRQRQDYKRTTYRASAWPDAPALLMDVPYDYLEVPSDVSVRVQQAAATIATENHGFAERVALLEAFFLQQQLSYSADNLPQTDTPVATFLFDSRRGYCEHFASAFAVMLRLLDVPARLVGGYLGGTYNRFGNFYLVTEDRAHVWVEALNDEGVWVRIDPSRLAVNAEQAFAVAVSGRSYLQSLNDALFHSWTRRVLNYDVQQQFQLLRETSASLARLRAVKLPQVQMAAGLTLVLVVVVAVWHRRRTGSARGVVHSYLRRVADCAGVKKIPAELGLYQLAHLSGHPLCYEFAERYGAVLYGDKGFDPITIQRLRQIIRKLKKERFVIEVALPESLGDNRPPE